MRGVRIINIGFWELLIGGMAIGAGMTIGAGLAISAVGLVSRIIGGGA